MRSFVHFIPILTFFVSVPFFVSLYRHWRRKPEALYLAWWAIGVATFGIGTFTEGATTILGWNPGIFKAWYISGALLGGAPLAQGTIYLFFSNRIAHRLTAVLLLYITVASVFVLLSPLDLSQVESYRLSGSVLEWQWVRLFSPVVNLYAVVFLIGGAIWSAVKYARSDRSLRDRMWGNIAIAVGAILPGIGGTATRAGYVEVLYVTEFVGLLLIWLGYNLMTRSTGRSIHEKQQALTAF
ncbi:MAG: hypothetical protein IH951_12270 [Bacteroidetes bacterium]|nr:hypothetical protein [Bacteroidota bacterium]